MSFLLGIDIGSSAIKAALVDSSNGRCIASAVSPATELQIEAPYNGWAEQDPEIWWKHTVQAVQGVVAEGGIAPSDIEALGLSYQMHGLVALDRASAVVRPAIIWCDSRALSMGDEITDKYGAQRCLSELLNLPGNFTLSKLAWVKKYEPETYERIATVMLPGDYVAFRLGCEPSTTPGGLSEAILWNYRESALAGELLEICGIDRGVIPSLAPSVGAQGELSPVAAELLGLSSGTPITYRAGDQPNNAAALGVFQSGEVATNAGTSGVVFAVTERPIADSEGRVNTFLHVNSTDNCRRNGVLMCINGCGSQQSWAKRTFFAALSYEEIDQLALSARPGSEGLQVFPYGNGAERCFRGRELGASFRHIDFSRHSRCELSRAVQEGIAYSFVYGIELLRGLGVNCDQLVAGKANLYLSPVFRSVIANAGGLRLKVQDSDGACGAALMAGVGAGTYGSFEEAASSVQTVFDEHPDPVLSGLYRDLYSAWREELLRTLGEE